MLVSKTLADLDAEYQRKREELVTKDALLAQMAVPPLDIHFPGSGMEPWATFEAPTVREALAVVALLGGLRDVEAVEKGCLHIGAVGARLRGYEDGEVRWVVPGCVSVRQSGGRGFYRFSIECWTECPRVKVEAHVTHVPWALRHAMDIRYAVDGSVAQSRVREAGIRATRRVAFGGSNESFDIRHYFTGVDHAVQIMRDMSEHEWGR